MKNLGNYVSRNDMIEVREDETVLVSSSNCDETVVIVTNSNKPFGLGVRVMNTGDGAQAKQICKRSGFSNKFVQIHLNKQREAYFCTEKHTTGKALCVQEIEENGETHLKLCIVLTLTPNNDIDCEM